MNYLARAIIGCIPVGTWRIIDLISIQLAPSGRDRVTTAHLFLFIDFWIEFLINEGGRFVLARTLSFNWKKEHRRELRRTQLIVSSCGARFRRMMYAVPSRYSRAMTRLMRVQLPCEDCEGQEAVCLWLLCTENTVLWEADLIFLYRTSLF